MIDLTTLLSRSMTFITIYFIGGIALTIYSVFLNFKQAKVSKQMKELIEIAKEIRDKR